MLGVNSDTMDTISELVIKMRRSPKSIRFRELAVVCDYFFGRPRQQGTSHQVYRMPWLGNPRVNIQNDRGMAKPYQVRQVLRAIARLEEYGGGKD